MASLLVIMMSTPALADETRAPPTRRSSSPLLVGGGAGVVAFGVLSAIGGAFLTFWAVSSHGSDDAGIERPPLELLSAAVPLDLLAMECIVGGAVMIALGARRAPAERVSFSGTGLRVTW